MLAPPPAAAPRAVDAEGPPSRGQGEDEDSGWTPLRAAGWISAAVAVAALGTAGFFAASAASKTDDVNRLLLYRDPITSAPLAYGPVAKQYQAAVDDGHRFDRYAKVALTGAGVAAVAATALLVIDAARTPEARVALAPVPAGRAGGVAGALAAVGWSF
jgi:hypothetical protein